MHPSIQSLIFLGLLLLCSGAVASETRSADKYFFDRSFWDLPEELDSARDQGKKGILIMFELDECPFCARMKSTVLNRVEVQDYFKQHFLIFALDINGDVEMTSFTGQPTTMKEFAFREHRVRATPVFLFFDLEGKPIKRSRFTGAASSVDEFLLLGRYVVEEAYHEVSFTRYKRSHRKSP